MSKNLNPVKFDDIFDLALSYWPESISAENRTMHKNGGATFPELIEVHDTIEEKVLETKNDLLRFMDWSIVTQLHCAAKHTNVLRPHEVNKEAVRKKFEEDLFDSPELGEIISAYKKENDC